MGNGTQFAQCGTTARRKDPYQLSPCTKLRPTEMQWSHRPPEIRRTHRQGDEVGQRHSHKYTVGQRRQEHPGEPRGPAKLQRKVLRAGGTHKVGPTHADAQTPGSR